MKMSGLSRGSQGGFIGSATNSDVFNAQPLSSLYPPTGKMPLPPLPKPQSAVSVATRNTDKNRTSHACNHCRKAKAKCSGGHTCDKCANENKECVYGDGKRDKERKHRLGTQNSDFSRKIEELIGVLQNARNYLEPGSDIRQKVDELLVKSPSLDNGADDDDITALSPQLWLRPVAGEDEINAEVGSNELLDAVGEDTDRDEQSRTTGFFGKSSAMTWVQRAKRETSDNMDEQQPGYQNDGNTFVSAFYHAGEIDLQSIDAETVNAFECPPISIATALVDSYFANVHDIFPVLVKQDFQVAFQSFICQEQPEQSAHLQQGWLCMMNLVFAIAAKFAHLTSAPHSGDERDHLIYCARAHKLGLDRQKLYSAVDIQYSSCLALLSLYFLVTDQLNRAWISSGLTVRSATTLGLHMRSTAQTVSDYEKEFRTRLWWSLYSLESLLDQLTGRPSCIFDSNIGVGLPINLNEAEFRNGKPLYQRFVNQESLRSARPKSEISPRGHPPPSSRNFITAPKITSSFTGPLVVPPSTSLVFPLDQLSITTSTLCILRTQLSIISHEITTQLYCASLIKEKWGHVQDKIRSIAARLTTWQKHLPRELDFTQPLTAQYAEYNDERRGLGMFYASCCMILYRCCLCRLEGRIANESEHSKSFAALAVVKCLNSARDFISFLPPIINPQLLYAIKPFWSTLHYLVEATSILMLEIAYRAEHVPSQAAELLSNSKTAVNWLSAMANQSIAARKGWEIFDQLLRSIASKVGGSTVDMSKTAPVPPGWQKMHPPAGPSSFDMDRDQNSQQSHFQSQGYTSNSLPQGSSQSYVPTAMSDWVDQVQDSQDCEWTQAGYPSYPTFSSTSGMMSGYSAQLQALGGSGSMYAQYDQFGPYHVSQEDIYSSLDEMDIENIGWANGGDPAALHASSQHQSSYGAGTNSAEGQDDVEGRQYQNWQESRKQQRGVGEGQYD